MSSVAAPDEALSAGWRRLPTPFGGIQFTGVMPRSRLRELWSRLIGGDFQRRPPGAIAPPLRSDWSSLVPELGDQDPVAACIAYSICACITARARKSGKVLRLAPRRFHLCGMRRAREQAANAQMAARVALAGGIPLGSDADAGMKDRDDCQTSPGNGSIAVRAFYEFRDGTELKREISTNGPVVVHMSLPSEFWNEYEGGVYRFINGPWLGSHAVCLVGYDDAQQCWIGKNSHGPRWGEEGFFRIRYGECGILSDEHPAYAPDL